MRPTREFTCDRQSDRRTAADDQAIHSLTGAGWSDGLSSRFQKVTLSSSVSLDEMSFYGALPTGCWSSSSCSRTFRPALRDFESFFLNTSSSSELFDWTGRLRDSASRGHVFSSFLVRDSRSMKNAIELILPELPPKRLVIRRMQW
jgi:hypothetical protein